MFLNIFLVILREIINQIYFANLILYHNLHSIGFPCLQPG